MSPKCSLTALSNSLARCEQILVIPNSQSTVEDRSQLLMKARAPVSEILAAAPTADFDAILGRGYVIEDTSLRMILDALGLTEKAKTVVLLDHHQSWIDGIGGYVQSLVTGKRAWAEEF